MRDYIPISVVKQYFCRKEIQKMKKKILTGIIALSLVLTIIPLSVFADNDVAKKSNISNEMKPQNSATIYYKFVKESCEWDYTSAKELIISDDITGKGEYTVTKSKSTSFSFDGNLTSAEHSAIVAGANASIGVTLTNAVGFSIQKEKSKTGHLALQPYRKGITGKLKTYNSAYSHINGGLIQTRTIKNVKYPVKDEKGKAKGNYYVHYARLHD